MVQPCFTVVGGRMTKEQWTDFQVKASQAWALERIGLSERKACREAKVNRHTYRKYKEDLFGSKKEPA